MCESTGRSKKIFLFVLGSHSSYCRDQDRSRPKLPFRGEWKAETLLFQEICVAKMRSPNGQIKVNFRPFFEGLWCGKDSFWPIFLASSDFRLIEPLFYQKSREEIRILIDWSPRRPLVCKYLCVFWPKSCNFRFEVSNFNIVLLHPLVIFWLNWSWD